MALPPDLTYRRVVWQLGLVLPDDIDTGRLPDAAVVTGTGTITPSINQTVDAVSKITLLIQPSDVLIASGVLVDTQFNPATGIPPNDTQRGIWLVCTDTPGINPSNFYYTITIALDGNPAGTPRAFPFLLPASVDDLDLSLIMPVTPSGAIPVVRGPAGDTGPAGPAGPTGAAGPTGPAGIVIVNFGTNLSTARPAGATIVYWTGTVTGIPVNAIATDLIYGP